MLTIHILQNTHGSLEEKNAASEFLSENVPIPSNLTEYVEAKAHSQYLVADYLVKNPERMVIMENQYGFARHPGSHSEVALNYYFPDGLPPSYEQMTMHQKAMMAYFSGVGYAVHKNIIPCTYSDDTFYSVERKKFNHIYNFSGNTTSMVELKRVDQTREYNAIQNAKCVANTLGYSQIALVYGGTHNFEAAATCFDDVEIIRHNFLKMPPSVQGAYDEYSTTMNQIENSFDCKAMRFVQGKPPTECELGKINPIRPTPAPAITAAPIVNSTVSNSNSSLYLLGSAAAAVTLFGAYKYFQNAKAKDIQVKKELQNTKPTSDNKNQLRKKKR